MACSVKNASDTQDHTSHTNDKDYFESEYLTDPESEADASEVEHEARTSDSESESVSGLEDDYVDMIG